MLPVVFAAVTVFYGLTQTGNDDSTRVRGTVTAGARETRRVPNAWVVATSDSDVRVTRADARGDYVFLTLLPGVYRLAAYRSLAEPYVPSGPSSHAAGWIEMVRRDCPSAEEDLVELSAGIEYQADLNLSVRCR
ncbi:MAG TPA: carboxypeptidase-like regulatory domain-containing protein [Candidatus Tumulicola sp.]|nr:carboxypeptidase-like regulatory domain-containing protein [Candidatus Tumulicola sp.]